MAAGELGVLLNGRRSYGSRKETVPNRSGSAPPSMEGSLSALGNSTFESSLGNLRGVARSCEPEEQLSVDPAYSSYYWATVNLNPQLPSPLISEDNCCLVGRIGRLGENRRVSSFDDSGKGSLFLSQPTLSTHKEEPEDDRSPKLASSGCIDQNSPLVLGQFISSSGGHNKSLVDLIQANFPRTSSPVYNNQSHPSDQKSTDKAAVDAGANLLHDSSTNMCRSSDFYMTPGDVQSSTLTPGVNSISLIPTRNPSAVPIPNSSCSDRKMNRHPRPQEDSRSMSANSDNGTVSGVAISNISNVDSVMKTLKITGDGHGSQCAEQHPHSTSLCPQGSSVQVQGSQSQMILQGTHISHNAMDNFSQGQSNLSSVEIQPVLHSTGFMPPFHTPAAAFGTPLCTNMQPSNFFIPQYGIGGYFLDTSFMPPVIAGYSPHSAIPLPPNSAIPMPPNYPVSPNFNGKTSGAAAIANVTPEAEFMQFQKIYGQLGLAMQTSITDPMNVQYVQHPSFNSFVGGSQFDPMASRGSFVGHLAGSCYQQKMPSVAYSPVRRPQLQHGGASFPSLRKSGTASPNYHGSPPYMEAFMSYPTSLSSTLFPGSPGRSLSQRGNDNTRLPLTPRRNRNTSSGWDGQRGHEKVDDLKLHSVLEELKSNKTHRYELSDVAGHIVKFSADQHGSRFIQQKLENCSVEERAYVFGEIIPHASTLMTNVFGNYVIQKFFEHGSPEQRRELADQLAGHILSLSLQMYGCRVIQKAFEVIELDQKTRLVLELDGHVLQCVHDQNGNHVIQKCIECLPTDKIGFIISAFRGQVATLSMHPYGCRVIQRVLEHCTDELQSQCIVDEILQSTCILAQDQYGNYVTQHVLERRRPHERHQITTKLAGQIVCMSQNKYASNVIEKCLEYGDTAERELLIEEIAGQTDGSDNLLTMMKDQFANYVVQKILETCTDKQRDTFLDRIRVHLQTLKKYNYGKHIVARIERLCSEGTHNSRNLK